MTEFIRVLGSYLGSQGGRAGGQEKVKPMWGQVSALGPWEARAWEELSQGGARWQRGCQEAAP